MKKTVCLFTSLFCLLISATAQDGAIPLDEKVRTGVLDNGMTYYIRHYENPEKRADFFIVHNVGALQEDDNQDGLAHFLEHLAFNGTRHFPGEDLNRFLASNGVMFGSNVNAYTAQERTVYNLSNIPVERESFVDSILLILHDWSSYIECSEEELEAERGVIREEWRRGDDIRTRIATRQAHYEFMDSKHSRRSVIGSIDVINNFKRQELLDFYHKWYRTDLQAVIVVGDIDVDRMERKVRERFSPIPAVENPVPKERYDIPHTDRPVIASITDPELKYTALKLTYKQPFPTPEERADLYSIKHFYLRELYAEMLTNRFNEVDKKTPKEEKMFDVVIPVTGELSDSRLSLLMTIMPVEDSLGKALEGVLMEMKRVQRYGFTQSEFERSKAMVAKSRRLMPRKPDQITNSDLVEMYVEHFAGGVSYMDPQVKYDVTNKTFDDITLDDVNGIVDEMTTDSEMLVLYLVGPGKAAPSEEESRAIIAAVDDAVVAPFDGIKDNSELLNTDGLVAGKIVKERDLPYYGAQEWTLSNGAKVVWKQVEDVNSRSEMELYVYGGTGFARHDNIPGLNLVRYHMNSMGVRGMDREEISAAVAAATKKNIIFNPSLGRALTEINGCSSADDFEVLAKMIHLYMTEPTFSEESWAKSMKDVRENLSKPGSDYVKMRDSSMMARYGNHPWTKQLTAEDCDNLTAQQARDIYMSHFGNAADYTFFIVGQLPKAEVQAAVEAYIASLPGTKRQKVPKSNYEVVEGKVDFKASSNSSTSPKATIERDYHGKLKYNAKNAMTLRYLNYILTIRYNATIREEKGGTYAILMSETLSPEKGGRYNIAIMFETDPKLVDELVPVLDAEIRGIAENGPTAADYTQTKLYLQKTNAEKRIKNDHSAMLWKERLVEAYISGVDMRPDDPAMIEAVTEADISLLAAKILKGSAFTSTIIQK